MAWPRSAGGLTMARQAGALFVLAPVFAALAFGLATPLYPIDLFTNVKLGELMLDTGSYIPRSPLSHTPVDPVALNAPWLAQVSFALAYRQAGNAGLVLLQAGLVGLVAWLLARTSLQRCGSPLAAALACTGALLLSLPALTLRPQLFSAALFPLWLGLLARPLSWSTGATLALTAILWANLHGGFVLGLGLAGAHVASSLGERLARRAVLGQDEQPTEWRRAGLLWLVLAVAMCVHPLGVGVYHYAWLVATNPIVQQHVTEWQSTLQGPRIWLLVGWLALLAAALARARPRLPLADWLLLGVLGLMAVRAERHIIWWAMASAPPLAVALAGLGVGRGEQSWTPGRLARRYAGAVLGLAVLGSLLPWWKATNPVLPPSNRRLLAATTPTRAADWLAEQELTGQLFNPMDWGGYLAWRLWPRSTIFADNLVETYPPAVWDDYVAILSAGPDHEALLERYGVTAVVVDRVDQPRLAEQLATSPAWRLAYRDTLTEVFLRHPGTETGGLPAMGDARGASELCQ